MKLAATVLLVFIGALCCVSHPLCDCPNEVYSECGTACPETCENLGEIRPCIRLCVRGCFCREGYVRNNATGECVEPCECPPKTPTVTTAVPV